MKIDWYINNHIILYLQWLYYTTALHWLKEFSLRITIRNLQSILKFPYILPSNLISGCETQAKLGKTLLIGV